MNPGKTILTGLLATILVSIVPSQAALVFTIEAPGVTSSTVPGVTTENFDDGDLLSPIGIYVGGTNRPGDRFGGAGGSRYLLATATSNSTLTFSVLQSYFGFWWSAGDVNNRLSLYDQSNNLLGSYVIGDIIPLLSPAYYGNPSGPFAGQNAGEPYAYLNFTATGTDFISRVVFGGSNFESDNHSVTPERITPPGTSIPDTGSTLALTGMALFGTMALRRFFGGKNSAK